ncbi:MAG: sigma-54 dependent transcriptional regulator [Planctomycetota bacterium]
MRVLLAEDEVTIFVTLRDALEDAGHVVVGATDTQSALAGLEAQPAPDVVITDVRMPGAGGMAVLQRSLALDAERPVLLMTGYATVDDAVAAMRMGAVDYVQKPFRNETIVQRVAALARVRSLEDENQRLRTQLETRGAPLDGVVGASDVMRAVFSRVRTVAPTEATVCIEGESGTGKERIALAVHQLSRRGDGPFIALSCAALPENLLEAELFGHERGAFTDAKKARKGRVELADHGTLFLDDIDDMPLPVQVKLLRVLQERTFERVGSEETLRSDFRVVVATKLPLRQLVRDGKFREDLFYRVQVVPVLLPPLRERVGDVPLLARALLARHSGGREFHLPPAALRAMERYPWPGNVRELENALQRAIALAGDTGELSAEDLLPHDPRWRGALEVTDEVRPLREVLREAEGEHLQRALSATGGHRSQAADLLGISRKVLWEKLRDHGIDQDEDAAPRGSLGSQPGGPPGTPPGAPPRSRG